MGPRWEPSTGPSSTRPLKEHRGPNTVARLWELEQVVRGSPSFSDGKSGQSVRTLAHAASPGMLQRKTRARAAGNSLDNLFYFPESVGGLRLGGAREAGTCTRAVSTDTL